MDYIIHLAILLLVSLLLAQGYNITFGLGQLFNLAHIALFGIGAYTTGILTMRTEIPIPGILLLSAIASGVGSLTIIFVSLRLKGDAFAVGSLALAVTMGALFSNWRSLTGGVLGIAGIPRPSFFGIDTSDNLLFLLYAILPASFALGAVFLLLRSPFSRVLRAGAEGDSFAAALGKDVDRFRSLSFILGSLLSGCAGSLYASYLGFIDPTSFSLSQMVLVVAIVIIGSPGSFWGVTGSCIFLNVLPEVIGFLPGFYDLSSSILGSVKQLLYASLLLVVVYIRRERIFPHRRSV